MKTWAPGRGLLIASLVMEKELPPSVEAELLSMPSLGVDLFADHSILKRFLSKLKEENVKNHSDAILQLLQQSASADALKYYSRF